jgi:hypothetical protein
MIRVKKSDMDKLSRATGAKVITSMDEIESPTSAMPVLWKKRTLQAPE